MWNTSAEQPLERVSFFWIFFSCSVLLVLEHDVDFVLLLSELSQHEPGWVLRVPFPFCLWVRLAGSCPKTPVSLGAN